MWPLCLGFRHFDEKCLVKSIDKKGSEAQKHRPHFMTVLSFDEKSISNSHTLAKNFPSNVFFFVSDLQ